jgi:hypothetical protein
MKTIEEAAFDEYQTNRKLQEKYWIPDICYMDWFRKGAEFAQRWIPVEEELPEIGREVLLLTDKGVAIGCRATETKFNGVSLHGSFGKVNCWRHIEPK